MTSVKKYAPKALAILLIVTGFITSICWRGKLPYLFFMKIDMLLESKKQIGNLHAILVTLSFWIVLLASSVDVIFSEEFKLKSFSAYCIPVVFALCVAVWGASDTLNYITIRWFWLCYYIGLIICTKLLYNLLAKRKNSGPQKIKLFIHYLPSQNISESDAIDRYTLYIIRTILLSTWFLQIGFFIAYCIENRALFPFV